MQHINKFYSNQVDGSPSSLGVAIKKAKFSGALPKFGRQYQKKAGFKYNNFQSHCYEPKPNSNTRSGSNSEDTHDSSNFHPSPPQNKHSSVVINSGSSDFKFQNKSAVVASKY